MSNTNRDRQRKFAAVFIASVVLSPASQAAPGQYLRPGQLVHFSDPFACLSEEAVLQAIALHKANKDSQIGEIQNENGMPACTRPLYPDANLQVLKVTHGNIVNIRFSSRIYDAEGLWAPDSVLALGESPKRKASEAEFGSTSIEIDGDSEVERDDIRRRVGKVPTKQKNAIARYLDGYYDAIAALAHENKIPAGTAINVEYTEETPGADDLKPGSRYKNLQPTDLLVTLGTGTYLFMLRKDPADLLATFPDANECKIRPHDNITYVIRRSTSTYIALDRLSNWLINGVCEAP